MKDLKRYQMTSGLTHSAVQLSLSSRSPRYLRASVSTQRVAPPALPNAMRSADEECGAEVDYYSLPPGCAAHDKEASQR